MADEKAASGHVAEAAASMAGAGSVSVSAVLIKTVKEGFPQAALPTFFADGILNAAPSENVVRFYLYRSDPELTGKGEYQNQVIAQVVLPTLGFLHAAIFFEKAVKQFAAQGILNGDFVENIRKREGL
jgi:hypothetical protein